MKKSNFTEQEIGTITKILSPKLNTRVNRSGNITVSEVGSNGKEFWTLYFIDVNRYIWRKFKWNGYGYYCHPLNMINRKQVGGIHTEIYNGQEFSWYNRGWSIKNSEFDSINAALKYFTKYLAKYRNIKIK